ncbi:MAG TPA: LapA family protein [Syntrophorhabdaceae bacterium]|nr:LapA family protein [Syntrophorhabdaceae bacterium]
MKKKLIIISILAFLLMILIVQNTQSVFLNVFFWSITMPQVIFIPILFSCGFVIGFLASKIGVSKTRGC